MANFKVAAITDLKDVKLGDKVSTSDFACIDGGKLLQFSYHDDSKEETPYTVTPGHYTIVFRDNQFQLEHTAFSKQNILTNYRSTKDIKKKIDQFFSKIDVYKELKIEPAKRGCLLYGRPGNGKSLLLQLLTEEYIKDGKTAVIMWPTDRIQAGYVKSFIKSFEYKGVERLILIAEDIGGVESDEAPRGSTSSMLSLLDNVEKTFKITTFIIATTNYPELFLENLTSRPGRFDDLIEVVAPNADERVQLLKFYLNKETLDDNVEQEIRNKKYDDFSAAHIKEVILRTKLYDLSYIDSMDGIYKDIQRFKNSFKNKRKIGLSNIED